MAAVVDGTQQRSVEWEPGSLNLRREVHVRTGAGTFVVSQDANSSEPGAVLWEVSIIVARLLDCGALDGSGLRDRKVLELGAGCAVAGLAYAVRGARVTFTDLPALADHVRANVERNLGPPGFPRSDIYPAAGEHRVVAYDWCDGLPKAIEGETFDVVLATDCVYHAHLVEPFLDALDACAPTPRTTVVLAFERRDEAVLARFERGLKRQFKCSSLLSPAKLRAAIGDDLALRPSGDDGAGEPDTKWLSILLCKRRKAAPPRHRAAERKASSSGDDARAFDASRAAFLAARGLPALSPRPGGAT